MIVRYQICSAVAAACIALSSCADKTVSQRTVFAMDTAFTVKGEDADVSAAAELLNELDSLFDRYSPESDIYAINERYSSTPSDYTRRIVSESLSLSEKYGNSVNILGGEITDLWNIAADEPVIPSDEQISAAVKHTENASFSVETMRFADEFGSIDLGAVAKGFALDMIAEQLNGGYCVVSAGSSVLMYGKKPDGKPFSVAVRDPSDGSEVLGTLTAEECFLSTSGGYERFFELDGKRYIHIFDLGSGVPCETDLTSVTVVCSSGILSDFMSTLIFTGGSEKLGDYMDIPEISVIAVTEDKIVYVSADLDFTLSADSDYSIEVWDND